MVQGGAEGRSRKQGSDPHHGKRWMASSGNPAGEWQAVGKTKQAALGLPRHRAQLG